MVGNTIEKDWIETKTDQMLAVVRRSMFRESIIADAKEFSSQGFAWDVSLMMSLRYWEGCPVTKTVPGL